MSSLAALCLRVGCKKDKTGCVAVLFEVTTCSLALSRVLMETNLLKSRADHTQQWPLCFFACVSLCTGYVLLCSLVFLLLLLLIVLLTSKCICVIFPRVIFQVQSGTCDRLQTADDSIVPDLCMIFIASIDHRGVHTHTHFLSCDTASHLLLRTLPTVLCLFLPRRPQSSAVHSW